MHKISGKTYKKIMFAVSFLACLMLAGEALLIHMKDQSLKDKAQEAMKTNTKEKVIPVTQQSAIRETKKMEPKIRVLLMDSGYDTYQHTKVSVLIQGMTVSSGSGLMGIAMHIFATSILVLVAGNIYRVKHTKKGAVLALICGVLAMTAGMVVFNYFITPYFITPDLADTAAVAANREVVKTLLVPVIVPFNLIKAGVNSVVTFLVYKTVSRHLVHGENWKKEPGVKQAQPEQ